MSENINNQYDFFKLVNLDADGNLGVIISGGTGGGGTSNQPFAFTAPNYTALLTKTGMVEGNLAYVVNSEGTQWLPGGSGGSFYPQGLYIYSSGAWESDRNTISLQLSLDDDRLDAIEADIATAIHTDEASEISAIAAKSTPTASDILLIEDAADGNKKKSITIGNLPSSGGGTTNLSIGSKTSTTLDVVSSTGTDATVPSVTTSEAGLSSAADKTKLDGIEAGADVTDATNVNAAGALMESEVTNVAEVKAFDSTDYATATQGTTADNALPKAGGAMTGPITTNSTFDTRNVATDGTKLDTISTNADVTLDEISAGANITISAAGVIAASAGSTSPLTLKGDLYTNNGTDDTRLPVGVDGQALVADSAEATGLKYINISETATVGGGLLVDLGFGNTNQVIANNAIDVINFDDTVTGAIDKNGDWDNTNKKFIVSSTSGAGTYQFEVNLFATNSTSIYYNMQAFINGVLKTPNGAFAMSDALSDSTWDGVAGTVSLDLIVGDEVEIKLASYAGSTTISANGTWNFTQGMRISKASGIKGEKGDTGTGAPVSLSKTLTLQKPEVGDDITVFRTDVAITVQEVIAVSTGTGTPTTTYDLKYSTDRSAVGSVLTTSQITTSTSTGDVASLSNTNIPADSFIWLEVSAIGGTDVYLTVDIRYEE